MTSSSPTNPDGTTSISYFFSDNVNTSDRFTMLNTAKTLRQYSNVQAFGLPNLNSNVVKDINFIDSNNGVIIDNASLLSAELGKSGLAGTVTAVNILVDGVVVDTIQPSELIDSPLGLTYEGSVDNLDVSVNGKNVITAEAVFNNNTATTSANFTVTAGEGKLTDGSGNPLVEPTAGNNEDPLERIRNGGDSSDDITLGYADRGANGGAGADYIVGNKRDNILDGGDGNDTIMGHEGNDTITTGAGTNKINGGDGIDTVVYGDVVYQGNNIPLRQAANTVLYNNTDNLTDVEFIQFSDVRLDAQTLQVVPILDVADISVTEGDSGNKTAQFTFNLSTPAPVDVTFNYSTADIDAVAGTDYLATSGQVTIPTGQTSSTVNVTVKGDITYEPNETFGLTLSGISGATFKDNVTEYNVVATIANDDPVNYAPYSYGIPNTVVTRDAPNRSINLYDIFVDSEDSSSALTYSIQNNTNSALFDAVTLNQANGILLLDYKASTTGISELTVRATDTKGLFVDTTFTVSAISATSNNDTITGGDGNDYLDGNLGNDNISGLSGDDTLTGGAGVDTLIGSAGDDTYIVNTTTDTITENPDQGIDTVTSNVTYNLAATSNLDNLTLTGTSAINATGNATSNLLKGNSANNNLSGGIGDDTFLGGAGIDTLIGGQGYDLYTVDTTTDIITENANEGTDTVASSVTYTLGATSNLENLTLTSTSAINATGNAMSNSLEGNSANNNLSGGIGDDTMTGGAGTDTLIGGAGNDLYTLDTTTDTITENQSEGTDTVASSVTYTLGANVENLYLTGSTAINGVGNSLNNSLTGNAADNSLTGADGDDTLSGAAGLDTMTGGVGNDIYIVDATGDSISETSITATEIDSVQSSITYTLGSNLENLTLSGTSGINGTGNSTGNSITGNIANNQLDGSTGNDTMTGGVGNDIYIVNSTGDVVSETSTTPTEIDSVESRVNYTLGANLENLILAGTNGIKGTGNTLNNTITGNTANNTLSGGTGNDTMTGGTGNDTYVVDATGDSISETSTAATEIDSVESRVNYTLGSNLENLTLTSTSAINGTGNTTGNVLTGNSGNNTLNGGAGIDTLIGGAGNDTYIVNTATDTITENVNEGTDTVSSSVTYTLGDNVENLTLTGTSAINGTSNTLNNAITGNSAGNNLSAGDGNDIMTGAAGNDSMDGGSGIDSLLESGNFNFTLTNTSLTGNGTDVLTSIEAATLTGGSSNNILNASSFTLGAVRLDGSSGNDTMTGGTGNDLLTGGSGNDSLTGGGGSDRFIYDTNAAFTNSALGIDLFADFVSGTDKIVLDKTTFTALTSVVGSGFSVASELAVVASDGLAATAGALIVYSSGTGNLFYNQNGVTNGLGSGEQFATLSNIPALNANDFVLQA